MRRFLAALLFVPLVACAGSGEVSGDRRVVGRINELFTAKPATVEAGKPVTFTLRLSNTSGRDEELRYSSGQLYDFWVTRGSHTVWRWSSNKSFTADVSTKVLGPLISTAFTETWIPRSEGTYVAHGDSLADGFKGLVLDGKVKVGG